MHEAPLAAPEWNSGSSVEVARELGLPKGAVVLQGTGC